MKLLLYIVVDLFQENNVFQIVSGHFIGSNVKIFNGGTECRDKEPVVSLELRKKATERNK